jgi:hypothetical protein
MLQNVRLRLVLVTVLKNSYHNYAQGRNGSQSWFDFYDLGNIMNGDIQKIVELALVNNMEKLKEATKFLRK